MSKDKLELGASAEARAEQFLKDNGYSILQRNYKTKLGEIDIIARDKDTLCFIEVKCRTSDRFGQGTEAVSASKQRHISRAALCFLKERGLLDRAARFDVVSLDHTADKEKISLIKNAFELDERLSY